VRALLELEGRLAEALPVRPLALAEGLLLLEGRLLTVGLLVLVRPEALAPTRPVLSPVVGRPADMLPLPLTLLLLLLPDMLPLLLGLPSVGVAWLIEPAVLLP